MLPSKSLCRHLPLSLRSPAFRAAEFRPALYAKQHGICTICLHEKQEREMHVDHVVPRAKGGSDDISNLQALCGPCNLLKGTKTQQEAIVEAKRRGIRLADEAIPWSQRQQLKEWGIL